MITITQHTLKRKDKNPIVIDALFQEHHTNSPILIFCHGYKGFKDWGPWNIMARQFVNAGCAFIKFNFSHNGGTPAQPIDFPDLEAFGHNNYTKELDDLNAIIDWTIHFFKSTNTDQATQLYLMGHSRGGGIVTIKAQEDTRINGVITLAGVSDYKSRFVTGEPLKNWQKDGVLYVLNGRTKQQMPHYYQFYEDFIANETRLTIERAAKQLQVPYLIIHGSEDTTVLPTSAQQLHQWQPNSELLLIDGANHVFNTKHPWENDTLSEALNRAVQESIAFIKRHSYS